MKRAFDLCLSIPAAVVLSPVLIMVAALILVSDGWPVIYRARRTGRFGAPFYMFKFRTMVRDAEQLGGTSTGHRDRRVIRIGWFLRRYKLDELPQLFNVIRGEMSIVGPRPEVEEYTRLYQGDELEILSARPGITDYSSLAFVDLQSRLGSEEPDRIYAEEIRPLKNQLRIQYVRRQSLKEDILIICRTVLALIRAR
jgi:lipopolysaccharide/colanic/teichoic acid biosynthesis glycosyltransferase